MFTNDDFRRRVAQLEARIVALERELVGLRSERRARIGPKRIRFDAVVSEAAGIGPGASGEVTIYTDGSPTTWTPTAHLAWMHGGRTVAYDTEIVVEFKVDRNRFEIASAACAAGGDHEPLPEDE